MAKFYWRSKRKEKFKPGDYWSDIKHGSSEYETIVDATTGTITIKMKSSGTFRMVSTTASSASYGYRINTGAVDLMAVNH